MREENEDRQSVPHLVVDRCFPDCLRIKLHEPRIQSVGPEGSKNDGGQTIDAAQGKEELSFFHRSEFIEGRVRCQPQRRDLMLA